MPDPRRALRSYTAAALIVVLAGCTYTGSEGGAGGTGTAGRASTTGPTPTAARSTASDPASGSTSASVSASSASPASDAIQVLNCGGQQATSSPAELLVTCGDGTVSVRGVRWSTFGGATAHGAGTLHRRGCTPNCAAGKDTTTPAQVTLSDPRGAGGLQLYGLLVVTPSGGSPLTVQLPG